MAFHGKKYRAAVKKLEGVKACSIDEAVKLLKETSITKFDSSLEIHMRLNVDPTHADQMVRATLSMPHGTGKEVRVVAFVPEDKVKEAKAAGAMKAGIDELIDEISKGWTDFDVAVATPDAMKNLGKIAKILGTKGLMPNPKAGTVTTDVGKTIEAIRKGRVEFRTDKMGQIHNIFGKVSFTEEQMKDNLKSFIRSVLDTKPSSIKGTFIANISVATAMGPGIKLDLQKALAEMKS
jgi:large subunit ribosomal protein L1